MPEGFINSFDYVERVVVIADYPGSPVEKGLSLYLVRGFKGYEKAD